MAYINLNKKKKIISKNNNINTYLTHKLVYNTQHWVNLRLSYLKEHPLCEQCLKNKDNKVTPACEVHHIRPLLTANDKNEIVELGFDENNLMSLCSDCHKKIHEQLRHNKK